MTIATLFPSGISSGVEQMKVMIVDDHEVVTEGLRTAIERDERFIVVGVAHTGGDARALARRVLPDVVILDMHLPDMPGDDACRQLRVLLPRVTVIALSAYLNEAAVRSAMEAGAWAYVTKSAGLPELRATLDRLWTGQPDGESANAPRIVKHLAGIVERRSDSETLTPQQARVLELLAQGLTYRKIALKMMISESTVRFHIQKLKVKFGTDSKTEMIVQCLRRGVISSPEEEATAQSAR
ncbi:response regulator transcription factor [Conexibacter sp. DBS9H8]|uniref:response regulator transcription factor n=1 Tax=Conexibacter sp. DBS9H8 TaxID=2937801 RepID=UPI00200C89C7|nr:response regulator transcription factor [Conexibacter sp. DBS9H8]